MPNPGSAKVKHPLYATWAPTWQVAADVYEGAGGFLDEARPYLVPHPREWLDHSRKDEQTGAWSPNPSPVQPSPKLLMRRKLARYENVAAIVVETVEGPLFRTPPTRQWGTKTPDQRLLDWLANADGLRTSLDDVLHQAWLVAAVFGHSLVLADKAPAEPATAADAIGPTLSTYTPLDVIDWLFDGDGQLVAVKLLEGVVRESFEVSPRTTDYQVRLVDQEKWQLYDRGGRLVDEAAHGFGRLPVVVLYGQRRPLTPLIGKSIMGDPQLYLDLYNLQSEVRELLRNQTFAILNVPIGKDRSVDDEMQLIGRQSGTANVLFSTEPAQFISPQDSNVSAYHEHIDRLGRMIYRLAALPWEGDSKDVESGESRQLKRADLHAALNRFTTEIQRADDECVELAYRAIFGAEGWERRHEADQPSTSYSRDFEVPDLQAVVQRIKEALALDLGETASKALKKQAVGALLPQLDSALVEQAHQEIDAQEILTAQEKQDRLLEQSAMRMGAKPPAPPRPTVQ